ncbi:hypothetical protein [Sciscionella sediminilitoris]|uniref:hypothetical protein n=1 Tax=Sciscionella sediminilitoris TaxID=1445613 RepID=UPI0018D0EAF1|nr:hypothetical protein [Sciscionella sp. SE31]
MVSRKSPSANAAARAHHARPEVAEIIEDIVDSGPDTADGDIPTESVHAKELVTGDIVVFGLAGEKRKWLMIVTAKPAVAGIVELAWPEGEPMQLFWAAGERVRRVRRLPGHD